MSAVSKKETPRSDALSMIWNDVFSSHWWAKVMVPRQISETFRPVRPRRRGFMGFDYTVYDRGTRSPAHRRRPAEYRGRPAAKSGGGGARSDRGGKDDPSSAGPFGCGVRSNRNARTAPLGRAGGGATHGGRTRRARRRHVRLRGAL